MFLILPEYYFSIHIIIVFLISLFYSIFIFQYRNQELLYVANGYSWGVLLYVLCVVLFIGLRPIDYAFGDMPGYANDFERMKIATSISSWLNQERGECGWTYFSYFLSKYVGVHLYFFIIVVLYILPVVLALRKLVPNYTDISVLFYLGSFSFFAYATNTVRSGVALSILIYAISIFLVSEKRWKFIYFILLCYVAYSIHHSVILPICCFIVSLFHRNIKFAISIWLLALILCLTLGLRLQDAIMGLGFDARMDTYSEDVDFAGFSRSGYRWDFMLYSFMPILLGWYIVEKKFIRDDRYSILLNTYIYSNAFWLMLNQIKFSDRFAYLSWFLYPLVLSYPLLKHEFSSRQSVWVVCILCVSVGFTLFMNIIYYG